MQYVFDAAAAAVVEKDETHTELMIGEVKREWKKLSICF